MESFETIIIGAGVAGLVAGCELAKSGNKVLILEARNRIGGRIQTIRDDRFDMPIETGAEFIHGDMEITQKLLTGYGIEYDEVEGREWRTQNGQLSKDATYIPGFHFLNKRLRQLGEDMTVKEFLDKYFAEEKFTQLREAVRKFVEGFDAAEPSRASILKFKKEWTAMKTGEPTYRVRGGYSRLMDALEKEFRRYGGNIRLSCPVMEIDWNTGSVEIIDEAGTKYQSSNILITVPLGVLQADEHEYGAIRFNPAISEKLQHARHIGYGAVIKIVLQFDSTFWTTGGFEKNNGFSLQDLGFIFSDGRIPTWWTQFPNKQAILTGWIGGPEAERLRILDDRSLLEEAIEGLSEIFSMRQQSLQKRLRGWHISNWSSDFFSRGAYSYSTVGDQAHILSLRSPLDGTLFFAGEALDIENTGTVEGALNSGIQAAEGILEITQLKKATARAY